MATDDKKTPGNTVFLPNIFDDTLNLLLEAHEYFQEGDVEAGREDDADYRALFASEMSRITMRLSSVMAWLMIQKAVFLGKLSQEDVLETYNLDTRELCLNENTAARKKLPAYMNYLLDESKLLYERVNRLEQQTLSAKR